MSEEQDHCDVRQADTIPPKDANQCPKLAGQQEDQIHGRSHRIDDYEGRSREYQREYQNEYQNELAANLSRAGPKEVAIDQGKNSIVNFTKADSQVICYRVGKTGVAYVWES